MYASILIICGLLDLQTSEPISFYVVDGQTGESIPAFEYSVKPGDHVEWTEWDTLLSINGRTSTYDLVPPSKWVNVTYDRFTELQAVPYKEFTVFVRAQGFEIAPVSSQALFSAEIMPKIELRPVEPIVGRIVGPDGSGIRDAPILIGRLPANYQTWDLIEYAAAVTDDQGKFTLASYVLKSPVLLTTYIQDIGTGYLSIKKIEPGVPVELALCNYAAVSGTVTLPNVEMSRGSLYAELLTKDGTQFGSFFSDVNTDSDMFVLQNLPPCRLKYTIECSSKRSFWRGRKQYVYQGELAVDCATRVHLNINIENGGYEIDGLPAVGSGG